MSFAIDVPLGGVAFEQPAIRLKRLKSMAFFAQKPWNPCPVVIEEGVAVRLSGNGNIVYVLDVHGLPIARFATKSLQDHWIERNGVRITPSEQVVSATA